MKQESDKSCQHFLFYEPELRRGNYPQSHLVHSHSQSASLFIPGTQRAHLRAPSLPALEVKQ